MAPRMASRRGPVLALQAFARAVPAGQVQVGLALLGGETICDEKRMDGTINVALSMAGKVGADMPKVITFITSAFLMISE